MKSLGLGYYYDQTQSLLCRLNLKEKKHIMWQFKVPMFNAQKYDSLNTKWIGVKTDKRRFTSTRANFDFHKKIYMNKDEKQYYIPLEIWNVEIL